MNDETKGREVKYYDHFYNSPDKTNRKQFSKIAVSSSEDPSTEIRIIEDYQLPDPKLKWKQAKQIPILVQKNFGNLSNRQIKDLKILLEDELVKRDGSPINTPTFSSSSYDDRKGKFA